MPLEVRSLPRRWTRDTAISVGDDIPTRNRREVELTNSQDVRPRLKIDMARGLPDPCPTDEPHCRIEARIDRIEGDESVDQVVRRISRNPPRERCSRCYARSRSHHPEMRLNVMAAHKEREVEIDTGSALVSHVRT